MASLADTLPRAAEKRVRLAPDSWQALALVWAVLVAIYCTVVFLAPFELYGGDDLMRLQQVRDLLAGQSWYDVTQYRMNPPEGAAMHWSRLVDLPLAAAIYVLGEFWGSIAVPMLFLGGALALLRGVFLRLGFSGRQVLIGIGLAALFPLLPTLFAPMRIDHHAPQALAALACLYLLLGAPGRWAAIGAGMVAAIWVVISLEGLPMVAALAALYGLRYLIERDRSLVWFLVSLAIAAPLLSLATRPWSEFTQWCDILTPAHWAAFATAAGMSLLVGYLPRQDQIAGRFAALCLIPLASAPALLALSGDCHAGPFATLDPLVQQYWYDRVPEGLAVWQQMPGLALPALYMLVLIPAGWWAARETGLIHGDRALPWLTAAGFALAAALYGQLLMREIAVAQLLTLPLALALLGYAMPRARALAGMLPRVLASFACLLLVTPAGAALAGKQLDPAFAENAHFVAGPATMPESQAPCRFEALSRLPKGHVFSHFNSAPAVIAHSPHSVEMGSFHRNPAALRGIVTAFIGTPQQAHKVIGQTGADYLVLCLDRDSLEIFANNRPDSFAQAMMLGQVPAWLEPVPGFVNDNLLVYKIR